MKRFISKYVKEPETGCWIWTACLSGDGYGAFTFRGKIVGAHRVSYIINVGEIPDGLCVLHKCDTPACVNPEHLFLGTKKDNAHDAMAKGRNVKGVTHGLTHLTEQNIREIRSLVSRGAITQKQIADMYNVDRTTVSCIKTRKSWAHI
jgi:hypothetical protein